MPYSGLHTRIPALLDASRYQAQFLDYLYCSLMSSTSAPLSIAVCIRKSSASLPLPRLSCRNFTSCSSAMQRAATSSSFITVSSRFLISKDLFEAKDLTSDFSPTAWPSAFSKTETLPSVFQDQKDLLLPGP